MAITDPLDQKNNPDDSLLPERMISLDLNAVEGPFNRMFQECIGAGRANEGLRADWQQQLAFIKKEFGFKYIRMHGLLSDDMGVYKEDKQGKPAYNFQYVDLLYDYLLRIGMKPFVELGFMPAALASGEQTIFWWKGNVTPPKDYEKWEGLIQQLILHFTERYGQDEVKNWYFEVWNEPNLINFWTGTQAEYFQLYKFSVQAIKSVNKDYRVGGPATAGSAWVTEMIDFCSQNSLPLDFISTHSYGTKEGYLDESGTAGTVLADDPWSVSGEILRSHHQIANSSMPHLELHYTEWSSSYTPTDPIHDSYHQAAYILEKIKQVGGVANSMSYWVFTDIFEEFGPRFTPFHGGFGLLNYQAIQKPAFYAYAFLTKLAETELSNADKSSWACKDARGNIQVLVWDFTYTHPGDSVINQEYYIQDLPAMPKGKIKVQIAGMSEGRYLLEIYRVGYQVNDPYATYLALNKPAQLTQEQVALIKKVNDGAPVSKETIIINPSEVFLKEIDIRENDVFLLNLIKI